MNELRISEHIRYIECSDDPLSADIGIIRDGDRRWLFDVGNDPAALRGLEGPYSVVLSHFHKDHAGSIDLVNAENLYVSGETFRHVGRGSIVSSALVIGNIRIFPLPSSHAKGCLGLEVGGEYAFVGDAVYCRSKNGRRFYNAQLLRDEIAVLKTLRAPYLLLSHRPGLIRPRDEVIDMLETVYGMRHGDDPEIYL